MSEVTTEIPPASPSVDVIALVASAGGLEALTAVLRELPADLPAAVVVGQHLAGYASQLVQILRRRIALPIVWAEDGARLAPGHIFVAPSRKRLEVMPDGAFAVSPGDGGLRDRPLDVLLASLADSFGPRALGVVLTGMGSDGAAGARALKGAGGIVIVQSEDTAEQPSMPRSAIEVGAADLVLPLYEIGRVVADVVSGGRLPRPRTEVEAMEALFAGPGEARAALRAIDWTATPLGPVSEWSQSLRATVRAVLDCRFPMFAMWGPEHVQIGNDAYTPTLGTKALQGLPARVTWAEIWDFVRLQLEQVRRTGEAIYREDQLFEPNRRGFVEEAYFTYCYSPLYDDAGAVAGILNTSTETTVRVLADRRLATLRALSVAGTGVERAMQVCERAAGAFAENPHDLPFALLYLYDRAATRASLSASAGVEAGSPAAPHSVDLRGGHPAWPFARAAIEGESVFVDDVAKRLPGFHAGPWPEPPKSALLLPLRPVADEPPVGVLVAGLSPRLPFDTRYREFCDLVTQQVAASLVEARTRGWERERLQRLAELDRVKTEFFQNVSHEFRTPLTLLLAPLEEALRSRDDLPPRLAGELDVAARNARRLLQLVDTLLDFSQMEAGRLSARFEPTDLATLTAGVASVFRGAAERSGLALRVDCPPLPNPVWVDRRMWEQVVSNLLSNALKHTFEGEIAVELRALPMHAELVVRDTGVGIPEAELPHLFKRFHRVRGARARTYEGSGIGLALVDELVRRHHGRVRVQSREAGPDGGPSGTTFTVWVPLIRRGSLEEGREEESGEARPMVAAALAAEAASWAGDGGSEEPQPAEVVEGPLGRPGGEGLQARAPGARVLVVDDNADLRAYLGRLLAPHWTVETAADGAEALALARANRPDLILADVMMPNLDGFELLQEVRRDEALKTTPVVLVTARAGEEAAVEGRLAGADDYLAKPFSARELVARVGTQLELARVRREATAAIAERERRTAEDLRDSEERFSALVEAAARTVWVTDARGEVHEDSPSCRAFTGQTFEEWRGWGWLDAVHPDDRERAGRNWRSSVERGLPVDIRFRLWHAASGTWRLTHVRAIPLHEGDGTIRGWVGMNTDITEAAGQSPGTLARRR
ncbi:MAG TPA: chemotaxis protein CheB [Thermoanaerobaculia bacterium]